MSGFDDIDLLIDTDPIALGERCRRAEEQLAAEMRFRKKDLARINDLTAALREAQAYLQLCSMVAEGQSTDDPQGLVDSAMAAFGTVGANLDALLNRVDAALASIPGEATPEGGGE